MKRRLLLVGWDAGEWRIVRQLVDRGLMPAVAGLIQGGIGGTIAAPRPLLSVSGWATIATGLHPSDHHLVQSAEVSSYGGQLQPTRRASLNVPTLWSLAAAAGCACHVVNFPATHPAAAANGITVSNYFALNNVIDLPGSVDPPQCLDPLQDMLLKPDQIDIASILTFVPQAAVAHERRDKRLAYLVSALAHTATIHAAATWCLQNRPWDLAAVCYTGLHQISHAFMPFHPPRRDHILQNDFDLYNGVVTAAYRLHDMMLARLLELAGNDANVIIVSDHGFRSDAQRPLLSGAGEEAMLMWHRPRALLIAAGPDIPRGVQPSGTLLQVMPTTLALLGIDSTAIGAGKPLFEIAPAQDGLIKPVSSITQPLARKTEEVNRDVQHLLKLGYKQSPDPYAAMAQKTLERSRRYYLAVAHLDANQPRKAIALLEPLLAEKPRQIEYQVALAHAYAGAKRLDLCRALVDALAARFPDDPQAMLAVGLMELSARRAGAAIDKLQAAETIAGQHEMARLAGQSGQIRTALGRAYLRLRRFEQAFDLFKSATSDDPDSADAQSGLAAAALSMGDAELSLHAAQIAVRLQPYNAMHYVCLAATWRSMGNYANVRMALEQALPRNPNSPLILRRLSQICQLLGDDPAARQYDQNAHLAAFNQRLAARRAAEFDKAPPATEKSLRCGA